MSLSNNLISNEKPFIGVGLRHVHYQDALSSPNHIDFVEVHAENFFAKGGITKALLEDINQQFPISLHATSLGLGSAQAIPDNHIKTLQQLVEQVEPILLSDHACFAWGQVNDITVHAGDLLPIPFNEESLAVMAQNVSNIQQVMGRPLLVENLSAYIVPVGSTMSEMAFLTQLCQQTDCKLLLDLNNLLVNAHNFGSDSNNEDLHPLDIAKAWLNELAPNIVGEFHLAGCTPAKDNQMIIDDHSQPVSDELWQLYAYALERFGNIPTLVEWDLDLPSWQELVEQAKKARQIANEVLFLC